ncbi:MAG TPA: YraN family protein [Bacteroidales bacterium]|jgi:putative endonuclease|nr:YraN family protein [Bacteroidales bacterium]
MIVQNRSELGKKGEELAKEFYQKNQFSIRDTNWRLGHLEVDIIAENSDCIVFCEVKTRSSTLLGTPEEFVTRQKQQHLIRAANYYLIFKNLKKEVRFDIITVVRNGENYSLHHIPEAFSPRW